MTTIRVYTSENHGSTIEVPLVPESTVADILDCVIDPVRGSGYIVAVEEDTEYILQAADNVYSFLDGPWTSRHQSALTFVLRYREAEQPWPPSGLEARRQQMRRPSCNASSSSSSLSSDYKQQQLQQQQHQQLQHQKHQQHDHFDNKGKPTMASKLPGGPGDLTLAELQEMATRQQQQMEAQQQVLVAKEQRLKYLKQQEARHAQLASESEKLRRIRERVESQELKVKKLRALRGQAEQYRASNGQLNSELDAVRAVFNEKEKELAVAVARVDQLTRQLKDLRNGKTNNGLSGQKHAAAALELEKLRKELLLRNQLNEQQTNNIATKEKLLQQKREEVKNMDNRILELQQRLKKRKLQEDQNSQAYKQAANSQNKQTKASTNTNFNNSMKMGNPYIQYAPKDVAKDDSYSQPGHFMKQDPKYQTLPAGARLGQAAVEVKGSPPVHDGNDNKDGPGEYKLPVVLPVGNNQSKLGYNSNNTSRQTDQLQNHHSEHILPSGKQQTFNNNDFSRPNQNFANLPPPPQPTPKSLPQSTPAQMFTHKHTTSDQPNNHKNSIPPVPANKFFPPSSTSRTSSSTTDSVQGKAGVDGFPSSLNPVISIQEEERQAGSGQSSPASSEGSSNSSGGIQIKDTEANINQTPIGSVSAMIERLNKGNTISQPKDEGKAPPPPHTAPSSSPTSATTSFQTATIKVGQNGQAKPAQEGVSTFLAGNKQHAYFKPPGSQGSMESASQEMGNSHRAGSDRDTLGPHPTQTSVTASKGPPSSQPQLNLKPAPTYRYASKNQIANTYMGRLGGAAMEKYQQNLNKLYKNLEVQDIKTASGPTNVTPTADSGTTGQEGTNQTAFGSVSPHDYPDIASDKGSYKLNTPKQVRRRHSDGESEDVNKALQDRQELEAKEQQQGDAATKVPKDQEKTNTEKSALPDKEKSQQQKPASNSQEKSSETLPPAIPTSATGPSPTPVPSSDAKALPASQDPSSAKPSKVEAVVRRTKSNLKKDRGSRRSNNRVSFDPLALLLDGSLEGELDLVKKVAVQVDDVSTPNDEGITALHNAICAGHYEIVKFLIEFGCDVNSPDSDGWTPLHCAASCNNLPMVRFLVEHGACVFATTISDQETAADKCEEDEDGYDGCSDYLYSIQEKLGITNSGEVYGVFDYAASNPDELTFAIGDMLTVLRKGDETEKDWWWATLGGKEGYIPRNLLGLYPRVLQQPSEVSEC